MIPSIFGTKEVDRSPVFTEDDIRKLVLSFPHPEPRPGKECLVRSLSGRSLVRSDAVTKRFHSLLQNATGPIFLNSLHNELGVHDVQWLLTQEEERIYHSVDRRSLLPETTQKAIYQSLKNDLANRGLNLDKIATEKDVTTATLRRILAAQDADLSLQDLENGKAYDSRFLRRLEDSIGKVVIKGKQGSVVLSDTFPQVPVPWLESAANNLIPHDERGAQGLVDLVNGLLLYTPRSLLEQRQGEVKQAQDAYIQKAVEELDGSGSYEVNANSRPQVLRNAADIDLAREIREAFVQKHSRSSVVELSNGKSTFLVTQDILAASISTLAAKAADTATEQWTSRRPGEEVTFDPTKLSIPDDTETSLDQAILESGDPENKVQSTFEAKILSLQESTTSTFATTIQTDLLTPLRLYAQGADTITDTTLQPRVQEFIYDWSRKDLAPETLRTIKDQNLVTTKAVSRDLEKFSDAISTARTLDDMLTATAKLARKQKIEQPSATALKIRKHEILTQKVAGMRKMKRASDLLQNVIWILLARRKEGLYMSSGKDTSRMIKMVKEGDAEAGAKLEEWRDLIKQSKDTDDTKKEMRDVAANAVEELKALTTEAASDEPAVEQVTVKETAA
ncbi:unnamed protein product [Aureobasidium uvarum]|uniref:Uncharacterized protein n=1 Tax=Aureobasidium uvarum TaxID=2773716 RepID=A0A9N8PRC7_9PEZI|nr:unnamed protein product [Aureobasidium uvarum]